MIVVLLIYEYSIKVVWFYCFWYIDFIFFINDFLKKLCLYMKIYVIFLLLYFL